MTQFRGVTGGRLNVGVISAGDYFFPRLLVEYASRHKGVTLSAISARFASSSEFVRRYGTLTNRQFVELVYVNVLGRAGESGRRDRGRSAEQENAGAPHGRASGLPASATTPRARRSNEIR